MPGGGSISDFPDKWTIPLASAFTLAHAFARKSFEVTFASRRPPEALAPEARAIGPTVVAKSLRDALEADTIILAVPFGEHQEVGAKVVKGFNHLVAAILATDPIVEGSHRVVFLSSDEEDAIAPVADLAKKLGFAPAKLGEFNEGGALGARTRQNLGSPHLPGCVQEGAVIDLRLCDLARVEGFQSVRTRSDVWEMERFR